MKTKDFEVVKEARKVAIKQLEYYNMMMKEKMRHKENKGTVKLELTEEQFLVINELLYNVELGDRNDFETAISDLMTEMDNDVNNLAVNSMVKKYGKPEFSVIASDDGFSIIVE